MASVLVNGFQGPKNCGRLILDEALMSYFGAIVMAEPLRNAVHSTTPGGNGHKGTALHLQETDGCSMCSWRGKERIITQGFGKGEGTHVLTIHEAQGLTSEGTVIAPKHNIHDSVSHAVVTITRYTVSCVYHTDDGEDVIDRFIKRALAVSENQIKDNNAKMAIRNKNKIIMNLLAENWKQ
ncbi:hypothetical protein EVAR_89412_1 [Eumeta japonica]|uniref:(+)RNA virus helicase C-terminal domain-containing protein n=1 Tax=Eumeta variegata TaxID=151549 RepID=A0A4C1XUP3_EUMVA|nr:hypothetical protein EVAR_89412_1 [Eumeta japonica]